MERSIGQARRSLLTSTKLLRLQRLSLNDDCNIVDEIPNYMNYTKLNYTCMLTAEIQLMQITKFRAKIQPS